MDTYKDENGTSFEEAARAVGYSAPSAQVPYRVLIVGIYTYITDVDLSVCPDPKRPAMIMQLCTLLRS